MKIISWNVNGIRSALSKNFREFAAAENPDVVCVQETKIDPAAAEKLDLPFKYRYFHCAERAGYSGVAIFSNVEPLSVSREALCGSPDEGRFLSADFGKFVLTSIYAPNSQDALKRIDYKHAWNTAFAAKMAESRRNIVCGDFNVAHCEIDIARPRENEGNAGFSQTERDDFGMILKTADLRDVWRERNPEKVQYSWWSYRGGARRRNVGWRLDYFLVSTPLLPEVEDAEILSDVLGSDHAPISIVIK